MNYERSGLMWVNECDAISSVGLTTACWHAWLTSVPDPTDAHHVPAQPRIRIEGDALLSSLSIKQHPPKLVLVLL
jgi:hypothetical protein